MKVIYKKTDVTSPIIFIEVLRKLFVENYNEFRAYDMDFNCFLDMSLGEHVAHHLKLQCKIQLN